MARTQAKESAKRSAKAAKKSAEKMALEAKKSYDCCFNNNLIWPKNMKRVPVTNT